MGVYEGRGQLGRAIKTLMHQWADTRSNWDDERARQFEEKYLQMLEQDLRNAPVGLAGHQPRIQVLGLGGVVEPKNPISRRMNHAKVSASRRDRAR